MQQGFFTLTNNHGTMFLEVYSRGNGLYFAKIHGQYDHEEMREMLGVDYGDEELEAVLREGMIISEQQLFEVLKNDTGVKRHLKADT